MTTREAELLVGDWFGALSRGLVKEPTRCLRISRFREWGSGDGMSEAYYRNSWGGCGGLDEYVEVGIAWPLWLIISFFLFNF